MPDLGRYTDDSVVQKYEKNARPLGKDSSTFVETKEAHLLAQMELALRYIPASIKLLS